MKLTFSKSAKYFIYKAMLSSRDMIRNVFHRKNRHTGIPGPWTQELDTGLWKLYCGFWTLESRRWTLDAGLCTVDSRRWTLDAGRWTLDLGHCF